MSSSLRWWMDIYDPISKLKKFFLLFCYGAHSLSSLLMMSWKAHLLDSLPQMKSICPQCLSKLWDGCQNVWSLYGVWDVWSNLRSECGSSKLAWSFDWVVYVCQLLKAMLKFWNRKSSISMLVQVPLFQTRISQDRLPHGCYAPSSARNC